MGVCQNVTHDENGIPYKHLAMSISEFVTMGQVFDKLVDGEKHQCRVIGEDTQKQFEVTVLFSTELVGDNMLGDNIALVRVRI